MVIKGRVAPFILSFVFAGFGQAYLGRFLRGGVFFALNILNPLLFAYSGLVHFYWGIWTALGAEFLIRFIAAIDAASIQKRYTPFPSDQSRFFYFLFVGVGIGLNVLWSYSATSLLGIQTFTGGSEVMEPTIPKGSFFMVNKGAYNKGTPSVFSPDLMGSISNGSSLSPVIAFRSRVISR